MKSETIAVGDVGASGGRVSALIRDGSGYRLESVHEFTHPRHDLFLADTDGDCGRRLYWSPLHIYDGLTEGLARIATGADGNLVSFGVDSWGSDGLWLSREGDPLFPPASCHCPRWREDAAEVEQLLPGHERFKLTGVYPDDFLVVNQVYGAVRHYPAMVDLADVFMPLVSMYHYYYSGTRAMEYTWSTTGHLGSCVTRSYCTPVFERLGLPLAKMPPMLRPGTDLGPCHAGLARRLGVEPFRITLPIAHDTACAYAASGVRPGKPILIISAGTWWCMGSNLDQPLLGDEVYDAHMSNVATWDGVALNIINMGSLAAQGLKRRWEWEDRQAMSWEDYNRLAAPEITPDMQFNIDDPALRTAEDMPAAVAAPAGLRPDQAGRGKLAALVYMGLARKAARMAETMGAFRKQSIEEILVIGGGAKNDLLNQVIADVSGLPVRTGPANATTLGNALSQAVALGWFSSMAEGLEALKGLWREKVFSPRR